MNEKSKLCPTCRQYLINRQLWLHEEVGHWKSLAEVSARGRRCSLCNFLCQSLRHYREHKPEESVAKEALYSQRVFQNINYVSRTIQYPEIHVGAERIRGPDHPVYVLVERTPSNGKVNLEVYCNGKREFSCLIYSTLEAFQTDGNVVQHGAPNYLNSRRSFPVQPTRIFSQDHPVDALVNPKLYGSSSMIAQNANRDTGEQMAAGKPKAWIFR
jgi:hypothetical protein